MVLSLLFLASLALTCLPLSWSYRDGARSESCYNMLVMHTDFLGQTVPPTSCSSSCQYQLSMVGRVVGENDFTVEEEISTTYQCGEVYQLQLVSNPGATFEGFMVEARENTSLFEEGNTIWGTWVTDPNNLYHAVECNRSSSSSEGPFENAATQNSPADLSSLDLYWRAPPCPNTTDECQQLPEIKFWFVTVQQRLTYFSPIEGLVLECSRRLPPSSPTPTPLPHVLLPNLLPRTSHPPPYLHHDPPPPPSPEPPTSSPISLPRPSSSESPSSPESPSSSPTSTAPSSSFPTSSRPTLVAPIPGLTNAAFIGLIVGAVLGGLLLITLVIVLIIACVYFVHSMSKKRGSSKYGRGKKHKNRNLYDAY